MKSKSLQLLFIFTVFMFQFYVNSYAQEIIKDSEKLTDEELKKELYKYFLQMEKNGATVFEISQFAMSKSEDYIDNRENYYKSQVYLKYMNEKLIEKKFHDDELSPNDYGLLDKIKSLRTYSEYLEWKKTDEAIQQWEDTMSRNAIRLYIKDINNMTKEEYEKYQTAINIISKSDDFNMLIYTDGITTTKVDYRP